jgi:hypothetical protein
VIVLGSQCWGSRRAARWSRNALVSCCVVAAAADYADARLVDSVWKMMLVYGIVEGFVGELLFGLRRQYAGKDRLCPC